MSSVFQTFDSFLEEEMVYVLLSCLHWLLNQDLLSRIYHRPREATRGTGPRIIGLPAPR